MQTQEDKLNLEACTLVQKTRSNMVLYQIPQQLDKDFQ